jgi:hypothetical protein
LGDLKETTLGQEVIEELQKLKLPSNAPDDFKPLAHPYFWVLGFAKGNLLWWCDQYPIAKFRNSGI